MRKKGIQEPTLFFFPSTLASSKYLLKKIFSKARRGLYKVILLLYKTGRSRGRSNMKNMIMFAHDFRFYGRKILADRPSSRTFFISGLATAVTITESERCTGGGRSGPDSPAGIGTGAYIIPVEGCGIRRSSRFV